VARRLALERQRLAERHVLRAVKAHELQAFDRVRVGRTLRGERDAGQQRPTSPLFICRAASIMAWRVGCFISSSTRISASPVT
jgi:hypothetical protein